MQIIAILVIFFLAYSQGIVWSRNTTNGEMIRTLKIIQSPPTTPYTFEVRATQRLSGTQTGDAIDWLFSVAWVRFLSIIK